MTCEKKEINVIKMEEMEITSPYFDPHPEKSTTDNHSWRQGLFVWFKDKNMKEFVWMPKWDEIKKLVSGSETVEEINREIWKNKQLQGKSEEKRPKMDDN